MTEPVYDLIIRGGRVATTTDTFEADIAITGETIIAIGEKASDWDALARSVLTIAPIFGTDMARPELVEAIARHLRGLLGGDARFYLAERLADE